MLLTALFVTMHHMSCYYYYVGVVVTENFTDTDVPSWVLAEGLQDMEAPARCGGRQAGRGRRGEAGAGGLAVGGRR